MMKKKAIIICSMALLAATGLNVHASETSAKTDEIVVVTREEGSGTRGVFAEKTNLENKTDSSNADRIRTDAKIAMNAETVIADVAEDENAIGYVSLGAVTAEMTGIKVLAIDGVTPESKTIDNDKYPLVRNFNIGYSGKLSDAENDFMTYIMSAGQQIVSNGYTSVKDTATFLSDQSTGTIRISGSSSAAPLLAALAEDYNETYNKNVTIDVQTTDSTSGLTAAMQESSDWGIASRELKDYENELLTSETIAKDGVAVIVNEANPCEALTTDQLTHIFDGTDVSWADVNQ